MSILDLFCSVDAFWQRFEPRWERELLAQSGQRHRRRATRLHPAEILTILILFQQSGYRTFKGFYTQHVQAHLRQEFPGLLSYSRFVALMPRYLVPLAVYLHVQRGTCTGISFIDSTSLAVCHPARIQQHRVFRVDARRGKTSVGWFYGFKLHLVVNDRGELLAFCLTPGNTDDRRPVSRLVRRLFGRLFGDKGYISAPLAEHLWSSSRTTSHHQTAQEHAQPALRVLRPALAAQARAHRDDRSINSRTSARSSTRAIAAQSTSSSICSRVSIAYCHQPKKPSLHLAAHPLIADLIQN